MKFINHTAKNIYSTMCGNLAPGRTTCDATKGAMAQALKRVVDACGKSMYIVLDDNERKLIDKILELDTLGRGFKKSSLPRIALEDPLGIKRATDVAHKVQKAKMDAVVKLNSDKRDRQAVINGEVAEVTDSDGVDARKALESGELGGFKDILAENARIAAKQAARKDEDLTKDPLIAGMRSKGVKLPKPAGEDNAKLPQAADKDGDDLVKGADAKTPQFTTARNAGEMDAAATDLASKLAFGNENA